jgi:hypothetical protein
MSQEMRASWKEIMGANLTAPLGYIYADGSRFF